MACITAFALQRCLVNKSRGHAEASGGSWAPGASWRLLETSGGSWRLLGASGGSWRLLECTLPGDPEARLEAGWRQAEGRLEAGWRQAGGRLEAGLRQAGGRLEAGWRQAVQKRIPRP